MSDFGIDVERGVVEIACVVLRNPSRLNAVRLEMWQALPDVVRQLDTDPTVRVLVLRGAGEDAFASGADISEFSTHRRDAASAAAYEQVTAAAFEALLAVEKPLVAMIHGVCIGGGLAIATCADLRIASDEARFALPAARLGLGYHQSGVERLVALLGPSVAAEYLLHRAPVHRCGGARHRPGESRRTPRRSDGVHRALCRRHRGQRPADGEVGEARHPGRAASTRGAGSRRGEADDRGLLPERRLRRRRAGLPREAAAGVPRSLRLRATRRRSG